MSFSCHFPSQPTLQVQESDFDLCMDVNARAILLSTSVIIPTMLVQNRGGTFIQIASTAADRPRPGLTWYSASKAAAVVVSLPCHLRKYVPNVCQATKSLAAEFAPHNIRFNSVCPVVGGTGMYDSFQPTPALLTVTTDIWRIRTHLFLGKEDTPENREAWLSSIPLGRFCQPADIANTCAFLSSDDASFITGIDLKVDGGRCC